ncbi:hypothetical protein Tco_0241571 [Tanacetum coccineum]
MSVHNSDDGDDYIEDPITLISRLDMSDPLHLHPNDSTALTVVSIKLKGTENYQNFLDESYMQIRSSILSREVLPNVISSYATISSEESHGVASGSVYGSSQRNQASTFGSNVPNRGNFQRGRSSNTHPRPNNLNNNRQSGGSGLVCENYRFTEEQMATLISLTKDYKVGKNMQANMAGIKAMVILLNPSS